jgi:RHS repeat-associated protein
MMKKFNQSGILLTFIVTLLLIINSPVFAKSNKISGLERNTGKVLLRNLVNNSRDDLSSAKAEGDAGSARAGLMDRIGITPEHGFHGGVPSENINLFNGNLTLKYLDISLPGPNGFDVKIWRIYNSKLYMDFYYSGSGGQGSLQQNPKSWIGLGWTMHMGRVRNYDSNEVTIEFPDGSFETAYVNQYIDGNDGTILHTGSFLKYIKDQSGDKLYFNDGTLWTFDPVPREIQTGTGFQLVLVLKTIENPQGHTIDIEYQSPGSPLLKTITDSLGRVITFKTRDDDPLRLEKIYYTTETQAGTTAAVEYIYNVDRFTTDQGYYKLTSFDPPELNATIYDYYDQANMYELKDVNTAYGGKMSYTYTDKVFTYYYDLQIQSRVVESKTYQFTSGGSTQTWTIAYPTYNDNNDRTVVIYGPEYDTHVTYHIMSPDDPSITDPNDPNYMKPGTDYWKVGLMEKKWITENNGTVISTEEFEWLSTPLSDNFYPHYGLHLYGWWVIPVAPVQHKVTTSTVGDGTVIEVTDYIIVDENQNVLKDLSQYGLPAMIRTYYTKDDGGQTLIYGNGKVIDYYFESEIVENQPFTDRYMLSQAANEEICVLDTDGWLITGSGLLQRTLTDYFNQPAADAAFGMVKQVKKWRETGVDITWDFTYPTFTEQTIVKEVDLPGDSGIERYTYQYGALAKVEKPTDPGMFTEVNRTISAYNSSVLSETNQHGGTIGFTYDLIGRITKIDLPDDTPEVFNDIDAVWFQNLVTVTQGNGTDKNTINKYWDGLGRDTGYTEEGDGITLYFRKDLDDEGRVWRESKGSTIETDKYVYTLDAAGRPLTITDPRNKQTTIDYSGNQKTVTDANTKVTVFKYESFPGLVTELTDAKNIVTKYTYDDLNRLIKVDQDGGARIQEYYYNGLSQVRWEKHPETGLINYIYALTNNLALKGWDEHTITYTYNTGNQVKTINSGMEIITYSYDANGRLISASSDVGWSRDQLTYNTLGAILSKRVTIPGLSEKTLSYSYDSNNNLASLTYPSGRVVNYIHNSLNLPETVNVNGTKNLITQITYKINKSPVFIGFGNGTEFTADYDGAGLLSFASLTSGGGANTHYYAGYGYDNVGNINSINSTTPNLDATSFVYDDLYRLKAITYQGAVNKTFNYDYDNYGNLTYANNGESTVNFTHNSKNQITNPGYSYDNWGRMETNPVYKYIWDNKNRLRSILSKDSAIPVSDFMYNDGDLRIKSLRAAPLSISITSPVGGEEWWAGDTVNITWDTISGIADWLKIDFSENGGNSWSVITSSTTNNGSYSWTIPGTISSNCFVRICSIEGAVLDVSPAAFSVVQPPPAAITVITPNGGENWMVGSIQDITWSTEGVVGEVKIEYTSDGTNYTEIINSTSNSGSYSWTIPDDVSNDCKVRISESSDGDPSDLSNSTFSIVTVPTITITSPGNGDIWVIGSVQAITWSTTGTVDNVNIEYSTDSGSNWTTIASSEINDGSYSWTIPSTPSSNCLVKISETDGDPTSTSNTFTISNPVNLFVKDPNGPNIPGESGSVAWVDYNADGNIDLFVSHHTGINNDLFSNNGNGTFTQVTSGSIVNDGGNSLGSSWGDFDNNGYPDLYIANENENNFLYSNNGDGTFSKITQDVVVKDNSASRGCVWGDYDNDGYLDLIVANNGNNLLYHANGDGSFTKIRKGDVVTGSENSSDASWGDYDNDGDLDLFVSDMDMDVDNIFYENDNGSFTRFSTNFAVSEQSTSKSSIWVDYDNDGDLDLFVRNVTEGAHNNFFYINIGGFFIKETNSIIATDGDCLGGASWVDYDNDGDLDHFVSRDKVVLYINNGDGTFTRTDTDITEQGKLGWGDYDNDGDLDLYISPENSGDSALYQNMNSGNNNWIFINLTGVNSNKPGIGSRVKVKATIGGTVVWQMREISSHPDAAGQSGLNAHFGLGNAAIIDEIRIEWPSGIVQTFSNAAVNQSLTIQEEETTECEINIYAGETPIYSGSSYSIGEVEIDTTKDVTFGIYNSGNLDLILDGSPIVEISGTNADEFTVIQYPVTPITPGSSSPFIIRFAPTSESAKTALMTIVNNDPDENPYEITLNGSGVTIQPEITITSPAGGETWYQNNSYLITWDTVENMDANVKIHLYQNSTYITDIVSSTPNNGSFSWTIPDTIQDGSYEILVQTLDDAVYDMSNSFTVSSDLPSQNQFTSITGIPITNDVGNSTNCAWGDYDNDGDMDLYVVNRNGENNFLYRNEGSSFTKITSGKIVTEAGSSYGCTWGDYDNDGYLDMYVANDENQANFLYQNNGDGTFSKIRKGALVTDNGYSTDCTWGDYNNDGTLDLFVTNCGQSSTLNCLYKNLGNGSFEKVLSGAVVTDTEYSKGACWGDYDNDNDLDLFAANRNLVIGSGSKNSFYNNNGDGTFTKITSGPIVSDQYISVAGTWVDYDNDGDLDLHVIADASYIYQNNGSGSFIKILLNSVISVGEDLNWGDYDNDGDLDLYISKVTVNYLYENKGNDTFERITDGPMVTDAANSFDSAWIDYDSDGDLDIFVANEGNNSLYRNEGNSNKWIQIKCSGVQSNTFGIGAKVKVKATIKGSVVWQMREISSHPDAAGQTGLNAHFGLGDAAIIDEIRIEWPSGTVQTLTNVNVNQLLTVEESGGQASIHPKSKYQKGKNKDIINDDYYFSVLGYKYPLFAQLSSQNISSAMMKSSTLILNHDADNPLNINFTPLSNMNDSISNRMISSKTNSGRSSTKSSAGDTYYIYSGNQLIAEYDGSGTCVKEYIYVGNRLIAEYQPQEDSYYYYMPDQINSTRMITDDSGNVVYSAAYCPYGEPLKTWVNAYDPDLKFSGKEREGYSGLDYFGARYYDHKSYRFNSVDPVITKDEALSNPQAWNLYAYCKNNPITYFDPDGRSEAAVIEAGKTVTPLIPLIAAGGPYVAVGAAIIAGVYIGIKATEEGYPIKTARQYEHELMRIAYDAWFGNKKDNVILSKGGKKHIKDTGLANTPDSEISAKARDKSISKEERKRYQKEEKARGLRNKSKREK